MKTFDTFGPQDVERERMFVNPTMQTTFHPSQIPYPAAQSQLYGVVPQPQIISTQGQIIQQSLPSGP